MADEGQTVCGSPADMQGRRLGEVGLQLRTLCHQTLGSLDYLFFVVIGFVIFAAGTVSAWMMGVVMVLYERYIKKKDENLDFSVFSGDVTGCPAAITEACCQWEACVSHADSIISFGRMSACSSPASTRLSGRDAAKAPDGLQSYFSSLVNPGQRTFTMATCK
ncbi:unnamed protein product [Tetraodon nigroviridis]|uniref:(spotted green pufferfish) hypothetical protein n=1 Tax=Tetraodon nigroviridis TaxID=99883 RepID=Q4SP27_TETNG|nr:unnamed protein product [Tetraodon nigroviridis]